MKSESKRPWETAGRDVGIGRILLGGTDCARSLPRLAPRSMDREEAYLRAHPQALLQGLLIATIEEFGE